MKEGTALKQKQGKMFSWQQDMDKTVWSESSNFVVIKCLSFIVVSVKL